MGQEGGDVRRAAAYPARGATLEHLQDPDADRPAVECSSHSAHPSEEHLLDGRTGLPPRRQDRAPGATRTLKPCLPLLDPEPGNRHHLHREAKPLRTGLRASAGPQGSNGGALDGAQRSPSHPTAAQAHLTEGV